MAHAKLKELEYSDFQAAVDHVRAASVEFMMQVARDESYSFQLQYEALKAAALIVHGPPPGDPVKDENDPRLVKVLADNGLTLADIGFTHH